MLFISDDFNNWNLNIVLFYKSDALYKKLVEYF